MAIQLQCSCGRSLTLRDELAGMLIRCPQCLTTLRVPGEIQEVVEVVALIDDAVSPGPPPVPPVPSADETAEAVGPPPRPLIPLVEDDEGGSVSKVQTRDKEKTARKRKQKGSVYREMYAGGRYRGADTAGDLWDKIGVLSALGCLVLALTLGALFVLALGFRG